MKQFRPSLLIEPRQPVFRAPIPIWLLMVCVFAIGAASGIGGILVTASMFP